jgi:hypothetical protein
MTTGQGSAPEPASVVELKPRAEVKPAKVGTVKTSVYLPAQAHRKLKEIAFAKDCKVHDLIVDGLNRVLADNGYAPIREL